MLELTDELKIIIPMQSSQSPAERSNEERTIQWSEHEIRVLIEIRGELERDFIVKKRNKALWEVVASIMKERGYFRSANQCKCKWKNLVNKYKGTETSDRENINQFPYFGEMNAIFKEQAYTMQQLLLDSETSTPTKKQKRPCENIFSDEVSEDYEENMTSTLAKKKKSKADNNSIQELLKQFFQKQQEIESEWRDSVEKRDQERRVFENEWKQSMERVEKERMMMEKAWHEREEQRNLREESRALKRDALLNTLLNKLIHDSL